MSTPRRRIERQTPEKGSPVRKVASRMSPSQGRSGFVRAKRRWRAEVGSSSVRCVAVMAAMGKGCLRAAEGGGG